MQDERNEPFAEIGGECIRLNIDVIVLLGRTSPGAKAGDVGHPNRFSLVARPTRQRTCRKFGEQPITFDDHYIPS
jgi:hypothetical protein